MPLALPTSSDGYIVVAGHKISVELWNAVLPHVHARVAALEAVKSDLEDAVAAVTTDALALVANSVAPNLADIQAELDAMETLLALAEDRLAAISSGGVVADNVTVQPIEGLEATNAQDALAEIMGSVLDQIIDIIIPTKLSISAKADKAKAEAGTDNDTWMSPLTGAQQIAALGFRVVVDTFAASGTFTKADDDQYYHIEVWGGGGGGGGGGASTSGGGGGGAYSHRWLLASEIAATEIITIGAGGAGRTSGKTGSAGGTTAFGSLVAASGGGGGSNGGGGGGGGALVAGATASGNTQGAGGAPDGGGGGAGVSNASGVTSGNGGGGGGGGSGSGGGSVFGGGGGGGSTGGASAGGVSINGGAGGGGTASVKSDGQAPGGGGGASYSGAASGDGARGEVRVTRFKRIKQ